MAKGLFLGFPGHGDVNPTIGVVKELIKSGDQISYYCTEEFRHKIELTGAKFISYEAIGPDDALNNGHISSYDHLTSVCNGLVKTLWETKDESYDYIIYDSMINIGDRIKKLLNIPYSVRSITTFAFSRRLLFDLTMSNLKMLSKSRDTEVKARIKNLKYNYNINFKKSFAKSLLFNNADMNIVFTSSYFQPRFRDFNDKYKFIGPSLANRNDNIKFDLEDLNGRKLVYISLGTVANKNNNFYLESLKAFENMDDLLIIMSVGKDTDISTLGKIPKNFRVYNYVPQLELLKRVDIFVTHGGMNSTSEGLLNDIPLVVVPQFGDQFLVAKRVEKLGAGIKLHNHQITASKIRETFSNLCLNYEDYHENARKIGLTLRASGGYLKAKNEIKKLVLEEKKKHIFSTLQKFLQISSLQKFLHT
ncbi:MAG: macrolide family glycosyltransferase [Sarcina sp.]